MNPANGPDRVAQPVETADRSELLLIGFVTELARLPAVVARLLTEHAPDAEGRCRTCRGGGDGSGLVWSPCRLLRLAEAARALSAAAVAEGPAVDRAPSRQPLRARSGDRVPPVASGSPRRFQSGSYDRLTGRRHALG